MFRDERRECMRITSKNGFLLRGRAPVLAASAQDRDNGGESVPRIAANSILTAGRAHAGRTYVGGQDALATGARAARVGDARAAYTSGRRRHKKSMAPAVPRPCQRTH